MRHIVDAIAHQGRNGDDELIHVSKNEIAGLDGLSRRFYGRELPRNPKTGLKEASWLQAVLPAAVGLGAGIITMNPVVGAAAGAAALEVTLERFATKHLLKGALTDQIHDRAMYMKGIDVSYYYEGYSEYKVEDL